MANSHSRSSLRRGFAALCVAHSVVLAFAVAPEGKARAAAPLVFPAACTEVKPEAADEARKAFIAGKTKSDESSYDEALALFVTAYQKDCTRHTFLQLIAKVLELQTNYDEAVRALRLYLDRQSMTGAERAPIETKIKNLQAQSDKRKRDAAAAASSPSAKVAAPPPELVLVREHTIGPWIATGAGVVVLAAGIGLTAAFSKVPTGCRTLQAGDPSLGSCKEFAKDSQGRPTSQCKVKYSEGDGFCSAGGDPQEAQRNVLLKGIGIGGIVAGSVIIVGGLLWHFLEPTGPVSRQGRRLPKMTPELSPSYAGLSLSGAF